MDEIAPIFDERTKKLLSEIKKNRQGHLLDFRTEISKITADVIAKVAFGVNLEMVEGAVHPLSKHLDNITTPNLLNGIIPYWFKGNPPTNNYYNTKTEF